MLKQSPRKFAVKQDGGIELIPGELIGLIDWPVLPDMGMGMSSFLSLVNPKARLRCRKPKMRSRELYMLATATICTWFQ